MWVYKWSKRNNYGKQDQLRIHPEEGVNMTGLPLSPKHHYPSVNCWDAFPLYFEALPFSVKVIGF